MLKYIILFFFVSVYTTSLNAQIYAGGEGDGYAVGEMILTNRTKKATEIFNQESAILLNKSQLLDFQLPCASQFCEWNIFNAQGQIITTWKTNTPFPEDVSQGYYLLKEKKSEAVIKIFLTH